ncbi:MAG: hypothetical protein MHM6MM_007261 [Cercozoa sp. M6MM]
MSKTTQGASLDARGEYLGFRPTAGWQPERVAACTVSAREFFDKYVATRTPVILVGGPDDADFKYDVLRDMNALKKAAADAVVEVEKRGSQKHDFGGGDSTKIKMKFGDLLDALQGQNDSKDASLLYMTTQSIDVDEEGLLELPFASPVSELWLDETTTFPLVPRILGNLVPWQYNLWMGASSGSSSGLHHDYHDNLYVLLRGRKQFRCFAPCDHTHMCLAAPSPATLYANGVLAHSKHMLADGSYDLSVAEWRLRQQQQDPQQITEAENEDGIEAALEAMLDAAGSDIEDDCSSSNNDTDDEHSDSQIGYDPVKGEEVDLPPNFSLLNLRQMSTEEVAQRSPHLRTQTTEIVFSLEPGDMLYLPASWFHDVTSSDQNDNTRGHAALNYWMYPPTTREFDKPYACDYWPSKWRRTERDLLAWRHNVRQQTRVRESKRETELS